MTDDLDEQVHSHTVGLLRRFSNQRKWLHRVVIGGGGLIIAAGEIGVNFAPDKLKPYLGMLWILGVLAVFGGLFLEPESAALDVVATSHEAAKEVRELEAELDECEEYAEALQDEIEYASALYETHRALMQTVHSMIAQGLTADEIPRACERLLDIVAERRTTLCKMGEEKWNFAIYLFDPRANDLYCVACRRWSRESEAQEHRRWLPGSGHTGNAFKRKKELVCANSNDPSVAGLIVGHESEQRAYDFSVYVSIASIPIMAAADAQPYGVLVATSDQAGRFSADNAEDRDTVEALRALANALETLFAAYNMVDSASGDSGGKNGH